MLDTNFFCLCLADRCRQMNKDLLSLLCALRLDLLTSHICVHWETHIPRLQYSVTDGNAPDR